MELLRALGALAEVPSPGLERVAASLGLGPLPAAYEHHELFGLQLVPYASIYLGEEGCLGGEARDRILGFWRVLGLDPPAEVDHLSLMLASYAGLASRQAAAAAQGDEPGRELARHYRTAFLNEHLLSWLPVYLLKLLEAAPPFYAAWAALLSETLAAELDEAASSHDEPMHFRLSAPFPPPG